MSVSDRDSRLEYLHSVLAQLWPSAGSSQATPALVVVPGRGAPRLLVPVRPRRAAAAAAIRYTAQQGPADRLRGLALAAAAAVGWCSWLPLERAPQPEAGGGSIDDYLAAALGTPVVSALALTAARANRKPVLQVFDRRGRTIAFAKVGVNALTDALVDTEAAALAILARDRPAGVRTPRVLHHGGWRGHSVLVSSPLAPARPVGVGPRLDDAMRAVVCSGRHDRAAARAGEGYLATVRAGAIAAAEQGAATAGRMDRWLELFDAAAGAGAAELAVGRWHGDWTPWNCARHRDGVQVWDWERFDEAVPAGYDRLHYALNTAARSAGLPAAGRDVIAAAPELLRGWVPDAAAARTTAMLYVLHLAHRYVLDDPAGRLVHSRVEEWALPAVGAHLPAASHGGERR